MAIHAPDLTKQPPRSPRVRLGGYVILPRCLDKGRATIQVCEPDLPLFVAGHVFFTSPETLWSVEKLDSRVNFRRAMSWYQVSRPHLETGFCLRRKIQV